MFSCSIERPTCSLYNPRVVYWLQDEPRQHRATPKASQQEWFCRVFPTEEQNETERPKEKLDKILTFESVTGSLREIIVKRLRQLKMVIHSSQLAVFYSWFVSLFVMFLVSLIAIFFCILLSHECAGMMYLLAY